MPCFNKGTQTPGCDRLDRLNKVRAQNSALIEGYNYDGTGNRTPLTIGAQATTYDYPTGSHRLLAVCAAPHTSLRFAALTTTYFTSRPLRAAGKKDWIATPPHRLTALRWFAMTLGCIDLG